MENTNQLAPVEYSGQRILTTRLLAEFYEVDEKRIRDNYSNNQGRYQLRKHYFFLDGDDLKAFKHHTENFGVVDNIAKKGEMA